MPTLAAQRDIVADRQAAREPDLGREQAVPADGHIVADLDLIVEFLVPSPITVSRRLPRSMVVPAPTSTLFWISTRPVCGTFRWPSGPKKMKP